MKQLKNNFKSYIALACLAVLFSFVGLRNSSAADYRLPISQATFDATVGLSGSDLSKFIFPTYGDTYLSKMSTGPSSYLVTDLDTGETYDVFVDSDLKLTPAQVIASAEMQATEPAPQQSTQRTAAGLRATALGRIGGVHAGSGKAVSGKDIPAEVEGGGGGGELHFEYNYVDIGVDNPRTIGILDGSLNAYAIGYEAELGGGLFFDLSYEYSDAWLSGFGLRVNAQTHTLAGAISKEIVDNVYGLLIFGNSWSDGGTALGGVQLVGTNGSTFFVNPGIGTSRAFGNLVLDASLSYLYQTTELETAVLGAVVKSNNDVGQLVVDVGARYNITDQLYFRAGAQYNEITNEDFVPAVILDKNWVELNSEIGLTLNNGCNVYVGHAFNAGHTIYDTHTLRAGFSRKF